MTHNLRRAALLAEQIHRKCPTNKHPISQAIALALLGLCLLSVWPKTAHAAPLQPVTYGSWRSCKMGGGGYIQNVVLCPSNARRMYSYVDVGGLFRSDDGGNRWQMLHGNWPAKDGAYAVRGLLVDPRDDKRLIAAVGDQWAEPLGIFVSRDAGQSWTQTLKASYWGNGNHRWSGFLLDRHPRNPQVVVTATVEDGVFLSRDNGTTWRKTAAPALFPSDVRFDRANPNCLWLCGQAEKGWSGGKEHEWPSGFYRSDDGGQSWRKLSDAAPIELLQDPRDPARLYGIWNQAVKLSRDGGASWQDFSDGLQVQDRKAGEMLSEHAFQALAAGPDFILTASTRGTFYRLQSGQNRWQKIERQGLQETFEGEEWFRHKEGGFGSALGSITVDPRDPRHWFFTDWYAIYQTFDAGSHWKLTIDGIEVTVLHILTQDPSDPGVAHLGMADNGYFWSENGGERFYLGEGISNNVKSIALSPAQPNRLYATGPRTWEWEANQIFVSVDRGHHWTRSPMAGLPDMSTHHCNTLVVDPKNPYLAYVAVSKEVGPNGGGVYQSRDGGKSWTWMSQGLPQGESFFVHDIWGIGREIAISPDGALICISRDRKETYRFDAADRTWTAVNLGAKAQPWSVVADASRAGRFFVGTTSGVFRSDDGGQSWRKTFDGAVHHVALDGARPNRVAAGTGDGVVLSQDGGTTWKMLDKRLPFRRWNLLAFAGERLLAGSHGNGAFWMPLSAAGARPIAARPATIALVPASNGAVGAVPQLLNGDMTLGTDVPQGWGNLWKGAGKLQVLRDTQTYKSAPAALSLRTQDGPANGSVSQAFKPVAGAFQVSGVAKVSGTEIDECLVAIQVFDVAGKQIEWINLAKVSPSAPGSKAWQSFARDVTLPAQAASCNLVLTLHGDGQAWLDDVRIFRAPSIFLD